MSSDARREWCMNGQIQSGASNARAFKNQNQCSRLHRALVRTGPLARGLPTPLVPARTLPVQCRLSFPSPSLSPSLSLLTYLSVYLSFPFYPSLSISPCVCSLSLSLSHLSPSRSTEVCVAYTHVDVHSSPLSRSLSPLFLILFSLSRARAPSSILPSALPEHRSLRSFLFNSPAVSFHPSLLPMTSLRRSHPSNKSVGQNCTRAGLNYLLRPRGRERHSPLAPPLPPLPLPSSSLPPVFTPIPRQHHR